jgi:hypothetical protein
MKVKALIEFALLVLCSSALLMAAGLYNHFPIVNPDTGAYIYNGFSGELPKDRPIFYSWFIRAASLDRSLWLVIVAQCLLCGSLIVALIQSAFPKLHIITKLLLLLGLCMGTSVCWFSGLLMPDIFTGILLLSILLLLITQQRWAHILLMVLIFCSILMHNAHLLVSIAFGICLLGSTWLRPSMRLYRQKAISICLISLSAWLCICGLNYHTGYGFKPSRTTHVFIMGRMCENGVLKAFLKDNCTNNAYRLCAYQDQLPEHAWDFLWSNHPGFIASGGWDSSEVEYKQIIKESLLQPKILKLQIQEAIKGTATELSLLSVGDGLNFDINNSNVLYKIENHFPKKLVYLRASKQGQGILHTDPWNTVYPLVALLTITAGLWIAYRKRDPIINSLLTCIVLFLLINALMSCSFANILPRLNARVFWVLPFFCMLLMMQYVQDYRTKKK